MATGTINKYMDGTDTGWVQCQSSNSGYTGGPIYARKAGPLFAIHCPLWTRVSNSSGIAAGSYGTLCTIPDEVDPGVFMCYAFINTKNVLCPVKIESKKLVLYNTTGTAITGGSSGTAFLIFGAIFA